MKTWLAILFTIALLLLQRAAVMCVAIVLAMVRGTHTGEDIAPTIALVDWTLILLLIVGTSLWTAIDSRKFDLPKYNWRPPRTGQFS